MSRMSGFEKFFANSRAYDFFFSRTFLRWFLDFCKLKGKCLEIGCGVGFTSRAFARRFDIELTATDLDPGQIAEAKKRLAGMDAGRVKVVQADATALPFAEASFDFVVEADSLHHIPNFRKALSEAHRVLKSGGSFFIMDEGISFLWPLAHILPFDPFYGKFTRDSMAAALKEAGFEIVKAKGAGIFMIEARKR